MGWLAVSGQKMVDLPWPVLVGFVVVVWGKRGWCLRVRAECRFRFVVTGVARSLLAVACVWAVRAAVVVVALTWVWVMERVHSWRVAVKDIRPVGAGLCWLVLLVGVFGVGVAWVAAVWAALRVSWQPVSQAQNSCSTRAGSSERRIGRGRGRRR